MKLKWFVFRAVWILLMIPSLRGENLCKREPLIRINVSAELHSDVLLPCNFNPTLLGSDKTADIAVVWSQKNTTEYNLVEITLSGVVKFWDAKGGRIETFPKLSESGNFSIVLQNVQLYDLSLYSCELINGTCSIAYQDVYLHQQQSHENDQLIWIIVGALAGGTVLLAALTTWFLHMKRRKNITPDRQNVTSTETDYENVVETVAHSDRGSQSMQNPIYEPTRLGESNACAQEEEGNSSDIPVYATVKKGRKVNST